MFKHYLRLLVAAAAPSACLGGSTGDAYVRHKQSPKDRAAENQAGNHAGKHAENDEVVFDGEVLEPVEKLVYEPEKCPVESGGFYGDVPKAAAGHDVEVGYSYEMITTERLGESGLNNLLFSLEEAFSESLLPTLFPNDCGRERRSERHLSLRALQNPGRVVGLSPFPEDKATGGGCQSYSSSGSEECYVVHGGLTLFGSGNRKGLSDLVLGTITRAMGEDGMGFNNADPNHRIVRLELVQRLMVEEKENTIVEGPEAHGSGSALPVALGAVAGIVVVAGILLAIWSGSRRKRGEAEVEAEERPSNLTKPAYTSNFGTQSHPHPLDSQNESIVEEEDMKCLSMAPTVESVDETSVTDESDCTRDIAATT